jgi:hypothetical protein
VPEGHWEAFCIDLCLAAQGATKEEAKQKLHAQVEDYVREALTIDREYAHQLLSRKAPWSQRIEYAVIVLAQRFNVMRQGLRFAFRDSMPMVPQPVGA